MPYPLWRADLVCRQLRFDDHRYDRRMPFALFHVVLMSLCAQYFPSFLHGEFERAKWLRIIRSRLWSLIFRLSYGGCGQSLQL